MKKKKILTEVFVLFFIAAVFMAVYVVIEMGNDWLAVLGGAVVLLIASYLLIDYRLENVESDKVTDEAESELVKRLDAQEEVQKAIYTVMKRGNNDNMELLQKIDARLEEMTRVLERLGDTESDQTRSEIQQLGRDTMEAIKEFRQDYQTGVKNLIKYEKENAKQIAEKAHTNAEMTIMELSAQLAKIQECLQEQKEVLESAYVPDAGALLPVLEDAKQPEIPAASMEGAGISADATDEFDAEAAIKAYMIEQGYVDVEEAESPEETEMPIVEPVAEEPVVASQKSEEEIASTLQSMASGDPNRALTPEEIAAMFAAIQ